LCVCFLEGFGGYATLVIVAPTGYDGVQKSDKFILPDGLILTNNGFNLGEEFLNILL